MERGRPKNRLKLSPSERQRLQNWSKRRKTAQALALRARIILLAARNWNNIEVADELQITRQTVGRWRRRFIEKRLQGLLDEPRPGAPRKMSDADIEQVITKTLESTPRGATHWSTRSMAKATGMSQTAISRIWRAFALQPHRSKTFKISRDPLFVDKVRDVVGLYLNPPDKALVLCVDEKSQIQALDRSQPVLPMRPGQTERRSHDYRRHGTTSLFAALDVATGKVMGKCYGRHRAAEFRKFLIHIDSQVPAKLDVHLILDNYSTHKTASAPSTFPFAFHTHECIVAEFGRALVRRPDKQANPQRCSPEYPPTQNRHPRISRSKQRGPQTFHLDEICRPDHKSCRVLLSANLYLRTLARVGLPVRVRKRRPCHRRRCPPDPGSVRVDSCPRGSAPRRRRRRSSGSGSAPGSRRPWRPRRGQQASRRTG